MSLVQYPGESYNLLTTEFSRHVLSPLHFIQRWRLGVCRLFATSDGSSSSLLFEPSANARTGTPGLEKQLQLPTQCPPVDFAVGTSGHGAHGGTCEYDPIGERYQQHQQGLIMKKEEEGGNLFADCRNNKR
jgi:hypothetical protein